jgi:hypothetical protein
VTAPTDAEWLAEYDRRVAEHAERIFATLRAGESGWLTYDYGRNPCPRPGGHYDDDVVAMVDSLARRESLSIAWERCDDIGESVTVVPPPQIATQKKRRWRR